MSTGLAPAAPSSETVVGGTTVITHNDMLFHALREQHSIPSNFLADFKLSSLKQAGGKGGRPMAFTKDRRFLVKELSDGDHGSLLRLADPIIKRTRSADSLICPMYLHFSRGDRHFLCMRNCLPSGKNLIWHKKYDLKGNRDDKTLEEDGDDIPEVHKRCFHFHTCWYGCDIIPLCNTSARKRYYHGKHHAFECTFDMTAAQAGRIKEMIAADAKTFADIGTMDYSLILGVIRQSTTDPVPDMDGLKQFVVNTGGYTYVYYMGIIDFLQEWTAVKKIAAIIKAPFAPKPLSTVPPKKYAEQFSERLGRKFVGTSGASNRV